MIDCHVITLPTDNQEWLSQCLKSLEHPEVTVHLVEGVVGNIGIGRAEGFSLGTNDYVTFADPDDWLEVGAWDRVISEMGDTGLCTSENVVFNDKIPRHFKADYIDNTNYLAAHHLTVLRRDLVTPVLKNLNRYSGGSEFHLMKEATKEHRIKYLFEHLYNWRQHPNQWTRQKDRSGICHL